MYGAIIGDITGSVYEWNNIHTKDFPMLPPRCFMTDDTVMTVAVARALMRADRTDDDALREAFTEEMRALGRRFPRAGYGGRFKGWLRAENPHPYNSFGNGSAMRASPCGLIAASEKDALRLARLSAEVTHNHPEGIRGAQAEALCAYLAKHGATIEEIRARVERDFYRLSDTIDEIRTYYRYDVTCQGSVPQAIEAFVESASYEDAIRNAISIGGDSDTIAAITGGIAWAYYGRDGLTEEMISLREQAKACLPEDFVETIENFGEMCG